MILAWISIRTFLFMTSLNMIVAQTACNVNSICVVAFIQYLILDLKLSSCTECCILSVGWFPSIYIFICRRFKTLSVPTSQVLTPHMKVEETVFRKSRHIKIQTPGNHPAKIQRYIIFTCVTSPS